MMQHPPKAEPKQVVTLTIEELVQQANDAIDHMGEKNPHKQVIYKLGSALVSLSDSFSDLTKENAKLKEQLDEALRQVQGSTPRIQLTDAPATT